MPGRADAVDLGVALGHQMTALAELVLYRGHGVFADSAKNLGTGEADMWGVMFRFKPFARSTLHGFIFYALD